MSEIGDLLYCPAVMVGCSDSHIVWQDDDMIPGGLIDFVGWARRSALCEGEITLQKDAPLALKSEAVRNLGMRGF